MNTVLICGGEINDEFSLACLKQIKPDCIIGVDKGLEFCYRNHVIPDWILGDFDSISKEVIDWYRKQQEIPIRQYKPEKDDTDMFLALRQAVGRGYRRIEIYGGLGGKRLDHTLANLQMLVWAAHRNIHARLLGKDTVVSAISDGQISFPASAKGYLSVFAVGGQAEGVDLTGLKYELSNHILTDEFPLGVSNEFIGRESTVRVRKGTLILVEVR